MDNRTFTIFGAGGFVGARLEKSLREYGHTVKTVRRDNWPKKGSDLGHVIFTIGMTAQFRGRPFATVETQTLRVYEALSYYQFESFLYLSSTRLYLGGQTTHEDSCIQVCPASEDSIYNLTKATAECLCLSIENPNIKVVRLSNVFGPENDSELFVSAVLREAAQTGRVVFRSAPMSNKDYIHVQDVAEILPRITLEGRERIYNVAGGANTTNLKIAESLNQCGIETSFVQEATNISFPQIDIGRLMREFPRPTRSLLQAMPELVDAAKKRYTR